MTTESIILTAFIVGIISACSLPLGTISSAFWRPGDRTTAFLMAFGGGALLAALTIDLVASTVEKGYFYPLAFGCIVGGLLFILLNEIVNDYGGFVRKASTSFFYFNRINYSRVLRILSSIRQVDVLHEMEKADIRALSFSITHRTFHKDSLICRWGDPTDNLYIIDDGQVELLNPEKENEVVETLNRHDVISWMDFLCGTPAKANFRAATEVNVWVIPRGAFFALVPNSSFLLQKIHTALRSDLVYEHLHGYHGMTKDAAEEWIEQAVKTLLRQGSYSEAVVVERKDDEFIELVERSNLFSLFQDLPRDELDEIATHLVYKKHPAGTTFYHKGYRSDRMYFIAKGSVSLIDPSVSTHSRENRASETAFGSFAFLTGCRHSKTVMATSDIEVWILRKDDLEEVLADTPVLASKLKQYIKSDELYHYLTRSQTCDIDLIARWQVKATSAITTRARIPAIIDLTFEFDIHKYKGAPLAIWLGILLDGIPESLVIGASLVQDNLSYSLIGGLFLSNYPEALSSSVLMRQHGFKFSRILLMWTSTMILTGIGAMLGSIYFAGAEPSMFAFVQGVAAGAMLTMIAQTMLPEAYIKGGSIIGFSTLLGFLAAIFLKTLE